MSDKPKKIDKNYEIYGESKKEKKRKKKKETEKIDLGVKKLCNKISLL